MTTEQNPTPGGLLQCTAYARTTGRQCRYPAVPGSTKCRLHGGLSIGGTRLPVTTHGRRSKHFPKEIMVGYEASKQDPDLLSMREEIHGLDGMIAWREERLGTGASAVHLKQSRDYVQTIRRAQRSGDMEAVGAALTALLDHIERGGREEDAQNDVVKLYHDRARLTAAEQARQVAIGSMMSMESALILMRTLDDILRRYVTDPEVWAGVDRELTAILDGKPGRTDQLLATYGVRPGA